MNNMLPSVALDLRGRASRSVLRARITQEVDANVPLTSAQVYYHSYPRYSYRLHISTALSSAWKAENPGTPLPESMLLWLMDNRNKVWFYVFMLWPVYLPFQTNIGVYPVSVASTERMNSKNRHKCFRPSGDITCTSAQIWCIWLALNLPETTRPQNRIVVLDIHIMANS